MAKFDFSTRPGPLVIGHRGVSGRALGNTLAAFRLAVDNPATRCDGVELDLQVTADGAIVVHHDPTLPTGEPIAENTLSSLRRIPLANGLPLPTLAEVLAISDVLELFLEPKGLQPGADSVLLGLIANAPNPSRIHVHAFDHRIIARLTRQAPGLSCGVLSSSYPVDPVEQVLAAGADTLWQEWPLIDEELVEGCRAAGVGVIAWTVNEASAAARLRDLGVAGLCGNWPERLR